MNWVQSLTENHPIPPFARAVQHLSLSSRRQRLVTSWLVVAGEATAGISLTFGILTPAGLLLAMFLNLNYLLLAGLRDQGEQGQNLMMILSEAVCFATAAGLTWSVDALLF